jgi:hypothetical protein
MHRHIHGEGFQELYWLVNISPDGHCGACLPSSRELQTEPLDVGGVPFRNPGQVTLRFGQQYGFAGAD